MTSTSFAFRTVLVAENVILGIKGLCAYKDSEVTVLAEDIQAFAFTTSGSQRLLCLWLQTQSSERKASGTILRLISRTLR